MKPFAFAAASLLALSLAAPAVAASPDQSGVSEEFAGRAGHHTFSPEDLAAFTDARIAALKAGLKLTAAQEKNWPALETALRDMAAKRAAHRAERREEMKDGAAKPDALDMLRRRSAMMTERAAELNKLADAAKPLYDTLDDAQKSRFGALLHAAGGMSHGGHFGWRHRRFGNDG